MCEFENNGCRSVRDDDYGCGCNRRNGSGENRGLCGCFGEDTLLIIAIIILFILLFCDCD